MLALLGYLIADLGVQFLPRRLTDGIAVAIARIAFAIRPRARQVLESNLASVLPGTAPVERRRVAREVFASFATSLIEFLRMPRLEPADLFGAVEVRGACHLEAARAAGRGVIVLSAHIGNWEWGAAYLASRGPRLHVLARPHRSRWVERLYRLRRVRRGVDVLPRRSAWVRASGALRRGEWVALLADRHGGHSACRWAAALARRTGSLLLPAVMIRVGTGRYAACFEAPISPDCCAEGGYGATMKDYVRRYPEQWCAFEAAPSGWA